jgi:O-methyltransferase
MMTVLSADFTRKAYIDLIKRSITNYPQLGDDAEFEDYHCVAHYDLQQSRWKIGRRAQPLTLLTKRQLDLVEWAILDIEERAVPGDLIEAGVWRGGCIILMRAVLQAHGIAGRKVFAADSFAGIPMNSRAVNDPVDSWTDRWVAGAEEVKQNIRRFGLLDDRIKFVVGNFADSLEQLAGRRFSLIRLDSDSYDSVEISLERLYPLTSAGGIVIIDDWHLAGCRQAVETYRSRQGIDDPIVVRDANAYWVKRQHYGVPGTA